MADLHYDELARAAGADVTVDGEVYSFEPVVFGCPPLTAKGATAMIEPSAARAASGWEKLY